MLKWMWMWKVTYTASDGAAVILESSRASTAALVKGTPRVMIRKSANHLDHQEQHPERL